MSAVAIVLVWFVLLVTGLVWLGHKQAISFDRSICALSVVPSDELQLGTLATCASSASTISRSSSLRCDESAEPSRE